MVLPEVIFALTEVADRQARFSLKLNNATPALTLVKAFIVYGDNGPQPKKSLIIDIAGTGDTDPILDFTNLAAGTLITHTIRDLINGDKHSFRAQLVMRDSNNLVTIVESAVINGVTPAGAPGAPVLLLATATGDRSFKIKIARHTLDNGSPIQFVELYLSRAQDPLTGEVLNEIITKSFPYASMYISDGFNEWLEVHFGEADGITPDSEFEATAVFVSAFGVSPLSNVQNTRANSTPNPLTGLAGVGGDRNVLVNFLSPNNSSIANILGLIAIDQDNSISKLATMYFKFNGAGFDKVNDKDAFGTTGYAMKDSVAKFITIGNLINNIPFKFKFALVNTFGIGDLSQEVGFQAQSPPSQVVDLVLMKHTVTGPLLSAFNTAQNEVDSTGTFAKLQAFKLQFQDPLLNWAPNSTKYVITQFFADSTASAVKSAVAKFMLTSPDVRTAEEILLSQDAVLLKVKAVASANSLSAWTAMTSASKLAACNNSIALTDAMTLYYKIQAYTAAEMAKGALTINDDESLSRTWDSFVDGSRVLSLFTGTTVTVNVVASIVNAITLSVISSPVATITRFLSDSTNNLKPVIVSALVGNGEIDVTIGQMSNNQGFKNPIYLFTLISGINSQSAQFTAPVDTDGYGREFKISLAKDLFLAITNGSTYTLTVSILDKIDLFSGDLVSFGTESRIGLTPQGKIASLVVRDTVDTINRRLQVVAPSLIELAGTTISQIAIYQIKESAFPRASALLLTQAQIVSSLVGANQPALTIAGADCVNDLVRGYIISAADITAGKLYGQTIAGNTAGDFTYLVWRVVSNTVESSSDYIIGPNLQYFNTPSPVTALVAVNKLGALNVSWEASSNDGRNSNGANLKPYIVERWSGGLLEQSYSTLVLFFSIPSTDTIIGKVYIVKVYAQSKDTNTDGSFMTSTAVTSAAVTAAKAVTLLQAVIAADGRSVSFQFNNNGSSIQKAFIAATTLLGNEHMLIPSITQTSLSPIVLVLTELAANDKIAGGFGVFSDSADGLGFIAY